ncbi:TPA: nucleotide sugar dehydrogenase [Streptococcus pneumoniae]|uniref:UDP-N-acetylmannosamine dehydrogenase MnaB n=2 Tax=Streptococcus TaxID=1301 RepID=Q4K1X3_STREE|nr:nucleotide sugar dehydrogenase [Streptococcus pneumoniae]EDT95489.1 NDP-N-acetyl-D-galactosaminuronic acid dehydrogenase [Streptococcus pneumoniae CDC0288-04]KAA00374.1 UDP-N-acetyl-D-mannosaminuronic acid dehydrogenase [Streptococcus pneumoniae DAR3264]KAA01843.1 UDP-N-acetyl-D-mannosaminuronic acid dehydrogenase [Streptococcus pneumoniae DAR831]KXW28219.1 UDP-N-acetyl-D-mannosaminuronic acid dehydrogenase [Streptococcus pneumoniae]KXW33953.1 UDP-N-acetyl-D-mannosaminuronic acid dehydrogen
MINVIGLGYIGLPTILMLATNGVKVVGTDYNQDLVRTLNEGQTTFKEDGLDELFHKAVESGVDFTTEYQQTDTYIISVPTPYDSFSKKIDPSYVIEATKTVLDNCNKGAVIIIESTVSPGTVDKFIRPVVEEKGFVIGSDIHLVHAPERIIPGNMVYELVNNNRTIGADDLEIGYKVKELYASFCKGDIVVTDIRTAEMTKVVENTFRAVNIAFANELAQICSYDNMNVYEIIRICNMHPRVNILQPGPGVGGHCISVDPWFLVGDYPELTNVIEHSMRTNAAMPEFVLNRIYTIMNEHHLTDISRVGLYGLTYKENVDDMRESPTLQLLESMSRHLATPAIKVYDPFIEKDVVANQSHDLDEFLSNVDIVVLLVGHDEILQNMDKLKDKIVLDTRYICHLDGTYRL